MESDNKRTHVFTWLSMYRLCSNTYYSRLDIWSPIPYYIEKNMVRRGIIFDEVQLGRRRRW